MLNGLKMSEVCPFGLLVFCSGASQRPMHGSAPSFAIVVLALGLHFGRHFLSVEERNGPTALG